jgi:hypothetical protein
MNCPNCNAPIDSQKQVCLKCEASVRSSQETIKPAKKRYWTLGRILFWFIVSGFASALMFPAGRNPLTPNLAAVAAKGKDIYVSIMEANENRKSLGLPPIWPKTFLTTTNLSQDISGRTFKTSTEYFKVLFDEEHMGTDAWKPYVKGIDYSKLAGMGIPVSPTQKLTSTNNMWAIAANMTDEDYQMIPVLITRNVDVKAIEEMINNDFGPDGKLSLGMGDYKTPFGNKGFVCVRWDGRTFIAPAKYATYRILFNDAVMHRPRDPSKPPIVYLMP